MKHFAVYPGSFDPITNGHLDLLERALTSFDKVVILVAANNGKVNMFSPVERVELIKAVISGRSYRDRVVVDCFDGLLVDYVKKIRAHAVVRGLRATGDFEYEFMMALMNRKLNPDVETFFLMTGARWVYTSSRLIKEAAMAGGCINGLVPETVEKVLLERLGRNPRGTEADKSFTLNAGL
ncbi:MAG: pantetheine-phosphate adenylyltransferase [Deltaproteobacteria bacterium]|nr:pantetheine-phosphate adenylyltransferase [Deltaproteobacteria bacterium]